jgi:hypothetical protein
MGSVRGYMQCCGINAINLAEHTEWNKSVKFEEVVVWFITSSFQSSSSISENGGAWYVAHCKSVMHYQVI